VHGHRRSPTRRLGSRYTLVAEEKGEVVAFAELERDGHLDTLYCRKESVGRGVGSRLYRAIERKAQEWGLERIFTEASITARPFFERQGFRIVGERMVVRRGVELTNFAMEKPLQINEDLHLRPRPCDRLNRRAQD
jgi:N-acetylglutamate synthase-like GNAT family acetyltransferase